MRFIVPALSLLAAASLSACGLKGDLYLPAKQPNAAPAAAQSATPAAPAAKGGDDSKAAQ